MNNRIAASLVIPFRNEALYIHTVLDSLAKQKNTTSAPWSVIFVDNGSTDDSATIIRNYCKKNRIRFRITGEKRVGTAYSRVTGLRMAAALQPEILISTDADTALPPTFIERTYRDMKNADALCGKREKTPVIDLWKKMKSARIYNTHRTIWNLEYTLFGEYFFGAYFALKTRLFNTLPLLPPGEHTTFLGEDIFIARRAYFMGATFTKSTVSVSPHPRRIMSLQTEGLRTYVGNIKQPYAAVGSAENLDFTPLSPREEKTIQATIIDFASKRLLWSIADAYIFWKKTAMIHTKSLQSAKRALSFIHASLPETIFTTRKNLFDYLMKYHFKSARAAIEKYIYENVGQ